MIGGGRLSLSLLLSLSPIMRVGAQDTRGPRQRTLIGSYLHRTSAQDV